MYINIHNEAQFIFVFSYINFLLVPIKSKFRPKYKGYLLNVGVRWKLIARVIIESNTSENMIFYNQRKIKFYPIPNVQRIFCFFKLKKHTQNQARETITLARRHNDDICAQLL